MRLRFIGRVCAIAVVLCCVASFAFCDSRYDRELIVQDKTRSMQVESVFKEMMAAYEDEDARGFLDYVSDERFRQDYITFTDALYNDFRNYEIHQVDYWIDRVVPDNVKQFLYVQWEKRYENLDDGRQLTQRGFSRFLFDEVDGEYLLIELAGNHLFGGSLQEWREEVPVISGQEATLSQNNSDGDSGGAISPVCDSSNLSLCSNSTDCSINGGYWYSGTCNASPQALADLTIFDVFASVSFASVSIRNDGAAESVGCTLHWTNGTDSIYDVTTNVDPIPAGGTVNVDVVGLNDMSSGRLTIDSTNVVSESNESNNVTDY